jgi:hypothetical protein
MWILDQFYALNPPATSICAYLLWFLRYKRMRPRFFKIPSIFVVPTITTFYYNQNFLECGF